MRGVWPAERRTKSLGYRRDSAAPPATPSQNRSHLKETWSPSFSPASSEDQGRAVAGRLGRAGRYLAGSALSPCKGLAEERGRRVGPGRRGCPSIARGCPDASLPPRLFPSTGPLFLPPRRQLLAAAAGFTRGGGGAGAAA